MPSNELPERVQGGLRVWEQARNEKECEKEMKCYEGLKPERRSNWSPLLRENDTGRENNYECT